MNQCKQNNGWILCPSKSFPGKFYYFNVLNGETAWSLNEVTNISQRRDYNIQTITDKSHDFPEPDSPPEEQSPATSSNSFIKKPVFPGLPRRVVHNTQPQVFGQASFPKYVQPSPYMPNIIWTPIQVPPLMPPTTIMHNPLIPQGTMLSQAQMMRQDAMVPPMMSQTTLMPDTPEARVKKYNHTPSERLFKVQTCNISLSKRFENYYRQSKDANIGLYETSTPIRTRNAREKQNYKQFGSFENLNAQQSKWKTILKEPVFKRSRTHSDSEKYLPQGMNKFNSLESLVNTDYAGIQHSSFVSSNKVDNRNSADRHGYEVTGDCTLNNKYQSSDKMKINDLSSEEVNRSNERPIVDLDRNDLRYLLVAKRRKSINLGDLRDSSGTVSGKKVKFDSQPSTPKKKVTFHLGVEDSDHSTESEQPNNETLPEDFEEVSPERAIAEGLLYVVSDFETLLDELQCIEDYVRADDKRRLVIAHELKNRIEAATLGASLGRQRVVAARRLARSMAVPPPHYVILPPTENGEDSSAVENYVLNSCIDIINSDEDDVIVITNNPQIFEEAQSLNIACFNTQEIKDGAGVTKPEISFELKKIQISVDNNNGVNANKYANADKTHVNSDKAYVNADKTYVNSDKTYGNADKANVNADKICANVNKNQVNDDKPYANASKAYVNADKNYVNADKIGISSDERDTNLFLQSANEFQTYMINNTDQKNAKSIDNYQRNEQFKIHNKESKINEDLDKLINITRKKPSNVNLYNKTELDQANAMEMGIENLFINKKQKCFTDHDFSQQERQNDEEERAYQNKNSAGQFENEKLFEYQKQFTENSNNNKLLSANSNKEQSFVKNAFEFAQRSGQDVSVNSSALDKCLTMYFVEDKELMGLIKLRMEEWICVFSQIMENALVDILIRDGPLSDRLTPPWVLYDATKKLQDLYGSHTELKLVAEKFRELLVKDSSKIGKLKSSMKPNDFMRILGCGNILIQTLKEIHPQHEELIQTDSLLKELLQSVTRPSEEEAALPTPVLRRCDVEDERLDSRRNFMKKSSDIVEYLKKHYPAWSNVEMPQDLGFNSNMNEAMVVRTFGRNLNMLNIDNTKSITIKNATEDTHGNNTVESNHNINKSDKKLASKSTDIICEDIPKTNINLSVENLLSNPTSQPVVVIRKFNFDNFKITKNVKLNTDNVATPMEIDDLNVPKHSNTFNEESAGPIVIRPFENMFLSKKNDNAQTLNDNEQNEKAVLEMINDKQQNTACKEKNNDAYKEFDLDALDYTGIDENLTLETHNNVENNETMSLDESISFVYQIKNYNRKQSTDKNFIIESNDNAFNDDFGRARVGSNDCKYSETFTIGNTVDVMSESAMNNDLAMKKFGPGPNDVDDNLIVINDSTTDSGFENESTHAYSLVKAFLSELSESFKITHQFIDKTILEFREDVQEDKRRLVHRKAITTHLLIADIIDKLKCIIQRESNDGSTLKEMLIKAGVQATTDKRMTRYRQVVTKCLEQAQLLQSALRTTLALVDDELDDFTTASRTESVRYFNIFE